MKAIKKHSFPLTVMACVLIFVLLIGTKFYSRAQTVSNASGWSDVAINDVGSFQTNQSGIFAVSDNGADIWGVHDNFHFVYQVLNGNGQITARIIGTDSTNDWAKAGVMVRETLDGNARYAMKLVTLEHGGRFQTRTDVGGQMTMGLGDTNAPPMPCWVRLVRNGDWVGGYISGDGVNWTLTDWINLKDLGVSVYVGLAWCNHDSQGKFGTAWFDQVNIEQMDFSQMSSQMEANGDGLKGEFFGNRHIWGRPSTNWVDPTINFSLADLIRKGSSKTNQFSIRWTGELVPQFSEPYTFYALSDDGMRIWINEQLIVDNWRNHGPLEVTSAPVNLVAGQHYLFRAEYFDDKSWGQFSLRWSSPSTTKQIIPQSQLYSRPVLDADGSGLPVIWEQIYFGQTGVDPNADPDGDGLSNIQEYQRHTDPTNPLNWGVPNGWTQGSIEDWGRSIGAASYSNGVFTIINAATNTMAQHVYYVFQGIGTNSEMVAHILGINGNQIASAGIMLRETLDSDARNAMLQMTPSNGITLPYRDTVGDKTLQNQSIKLKAPYWLKVVRNGDWFGGYISPDGTSWTLVDWEFIKGLSPQAFLGLAVTCQGNLVSSNVLTAAQFDQVNIGPADPADTLNPVEGTGDGLMASYHNGSLLYLPGLTNRVEPTENYYFVHGPPFTFLNPDGYGVSWSGEIQAQFSEPYRFSIQTRREDWVRVWLNDKLIIDGWRKWHPDYKVYSDPINLVAGQHYMIRVEMYDNLGQGISILRWTSPSTPEHIVGQSQLYSQPVLDPDGSGLPVIWEETYFGHTGIDPNADADNDSLSNLDEYKYHTNPLKPDTDGDGMPDQWEIAHGLDPQFDDSALDAENSGYSNLQDYQLGLNPLNPDSNNDGLPDVFEKVYLGTGNDLFSTNQITIAAAARGMDAIPYLGNWQVDGSDIYCLDRRGGVDFPMTISTPDKYVLNLFGTQNKPNQFETEFKLLLSIDGQSLGHYTLNAGYRTNGEVTLVLPYLQAGHHTVRVFWDGHANYSSLRIHQLQFLSVSGATNQLGIKKWAMQMIRNESGLDNTNAVISSYTSPICLEGDDPYPSFMQLTNNLTNNLSATSTSDGRWYANVPLKAGSQTLLQASYQNGAFSQSRYLRWQQVNLLSATNLVIRAGDALLFNALPTNGVDGTLQVSVGNNAFNSQTTQPVPYRFMSNGLYTVTGTYTTNGASISGSIVVDVVQQNLPNVQPAAWTGMQRPLVISGIAPEAMLQVDSRLSCVINGSTNGVTQLVLATGDNDPLSMVTRIGTNGPVLDSTTVSGFDIWTGNQTYGRVVQTYPDGSQLIETLMVASPVETNVVFVLKPIVSGVIFEDGTTTKTLTSADFDALGQCPVRFIRPASVTTSACHQIQAFQGNYQIGYRH